jgi:hypothetical protein
MAADVGMGVDGETGIDAQRDAGAPAERIRARPDAGELFDALGLNRVDARAEGAVDLVVALGHAAKDDFFGWKAGLENEPELAPRNDVGPAPLIEERA